MAGRGRPRAELVLTDAERETRTRWARRRACAQALRSRIVLGCAEGLSSKQVAARERVSHADGGQVVAPVHRGALRRARHRR
jgi:hypothetical protein